MRGGDERRRKQRLGRLYDRSRQLRNYLLVPHSDYLIIGSQVRLCSNFPQHITRGAMPNGIKPRKWKGRGVLLKALKLCEVLEVIL